jgi:8-oxo-dGTP pyrophosphatase MutT (NUDIX family)
MESAIDGTTLNGDTKRSAESDLILLLKTRAPGKYHLPGGGIDVGDTLESTRAYHGLSFYTNMPSPNAWLANNDQAVDGSAKRRLGSCSRTYNRLIFQATGIKSLSSVP